jgi:hypothetical protein
MVARPGGGTGAGGNEIGLVADLGEGGGSGAEGSWIGAVARLSVEAGMEPVEAVGTGEVASRGCVVPAPGRARRVMRTVSFFSGTAEVLGGGMAAVFGVGGGSSSLMGWLSSGNWKLACLFSGTLALASMRFSKCRGKKVFTAKGEVLRNQRITHFALRTEHFYLLGDRTTQARRRPRRHGWSAWLAKEQGRAFAGRGVTWGCCGV